MASVADTVLNHHSLTHIDNGCNSIGAWGLGIVAWLPILYGIGPSLMTMHNCAGSVPFFLFDKVVEALFRYQRSKNIVYLRPHYCCVVWVVGWLVVWLLGCNPGTGLLLPPVNGRLVVCLATCLATKLGPLYIFWSQNSVTDYAT